MQKILHFCLQALCNILAREGGESARSEVRCQRDEQQSCVIPTRSPFSKKGLCKAESFFFVQNHVRDSNPEGSAKQKCKIKRYCQLNLDEYNKKNREGGKKMDFSKQFAIIGKLKSLVKFPKRFYRGGVDNQISEDIAKKIQKSSYDKSHKSQVDSFTPPYKEIAAQLQVSNDQIFKAAVFNLINIAINRKQYAAPVLSVLEKTLDDKTKTKEQLDYVREKIMQIRQIK